MVLVPSSATSMHTFSLGLGAGPDQNFVVLLSVFCSSNCFGAYKNKSKPITSVCFFIWFFTSHKQSFSYIGLNQY